MRHPRALLRLAPVSLLASMVVLGVPGPAAPRVESGSIALTGSSAAAKPGWEKVTTPQMTTNLIGFQWKGAVPGRLEVQVRRNGAWMDWESVSGSPDEGPDLGSPERKAGTWTEPMWVGRGVELVRVRVAEGRLEGLKMHMVRSDPRKPKPGSAAATPAQPHVITRPQWGADETWRDCIPDEADKVQFAVVHHTATENEYPPEEAAAIVQGIYRFHRFSRGFCDIGYNFLISRHGQIFEGRYGGITRAIQGAHAQGFNYRGTGVSMIGNQELAPVTPAQYNALKWLLTWKLTYHGVDAGAHVTITTSGSNKWPAGSAVTLPTIFGHSDVALTACPGDHGYPLLPNLRKEVQWDAMNTPPYPLPGWKPVESEPRLLVLDSWGGLHPAGKEVAMTHSGHWPGWAIARGAVRQAQGGYVVNGWGGFHSFGGGTTPTGGPYWQGWDIARGVGPRLGGSSGWVLDAWGGLHPYGGAPSASGGYWPGWDITRGIAVNTTGTGGYVLDGWGGIHAFGASPAIAGGPYWHGWDIARGVVLRSNGVSGYVLDAFGGVHAFGGAPSVNVSRYTAGSDEARSLVLNSDGTGGWVLDAHGYLWPFGNAYWVTTSLTWTWMGLGQAVVRGPA